eukprot:TRINITY_DN27348_c0_g1_i1.p1 TRINITY_DN27348_c0_g1~~TRINITY_DN27348_c0_g1_i1.p1  ORF type:complete len:437 (+),score=74.33 TRINITY_DN27348_c0_g1_i1:81-1391(+)
MSNASKLKLDSKLAHFYMMVIGIGYLFPISAIWAAFDYWKLLFGGNVEFSVTVVYQIGSVLTVFALSFGTTFSFGPRIYGGFCGQFLCLAAIMFSRWCAIELDLLYTLLLAAVVLVSVATGFLDSALLALCSSYSPEMQGSLQVGIGLGTFVSVMYRDATKVLVPNDLVDATTAYFSVTLATIIICAICYQRLMRLPVSRHLHGGGLQDALLSPMAAMTPPVVPAVPSPSSPLPGHLHRGISGRTDEEAEKAAPTTLDAEAEASFGRVWKLVWFNQSVIFANMFLTTLCYPGVITSIPCRDWLALQENSWFQTLLLTAFTIVDTIVRFFTHRRMCLHYGNIWITVIIRVALFPLMLYCVASSSAGDWLAVLVVAAFGALNGYCVSLSLIVVNEIPQLTLEQRKTCGRISAFSVNGGLCLGSFGAAFVSYWLNGLSL